jgi:hypothetical protein
MSLQDIANHLAAKGRGPDTTLVHMTEGEVKSLQDIAKAHGGSLTINPQTGLPEAGFLSSILPMVAGAGLMAMGVPTPLMAAGLVGGGSLLLNPNQGIKGALLSGLSAYGGAGLGQALAQQGAATVASQKLTEEAAKNAAAEGIPLMPGYQQVAASQLTPAQIAEQAGTDFMSRAGNMQQGFTGDNLLKIAGKNPYATASIVAAPLLAQEQPGLATVEKDRDMGQRFSFNANRAEPLPEPDTPGYADMGNNFGVERSYFRPTYARISNEEARSLYGYASGGPVEQMSNNAAIGANTMYPMANTRTTAFSSPFQEPISTNMLSQVGDDRVNSMTGESSMQGTRLAAGGATGYGLGGLADAIKNNPEFASRFHGAFEAAKPIEKYMYDPEQQQYTQQMASGGISNLQYNLGGYSDGGRLLRGPGDGVSDSIPATIANKQPARLADGEFVVPARIVSELGNGSTEAGARKLYAMMDRVQKARGKTVGKGKVAQNSNAAKYLPA